MENIKKTELCHADPLFCCTISPKKVQLKDLIEATIFLKIERYILTAVQRANESPVLFQYE